MSIVVCVWGGGMGVGVKLNCISDGAQSFYIDKSIKLVYIPVQRAPGLGILNTSSLTYRRLYVDLVMCA